MKRFLLALIGAFLLTSSPASAQSDTFIEALKYYNMGDSRNAAALLRKELASNPENDAACFYLAKSLLNDKSRDNVAEVGTLLKKAAEIDPGNYWYKHTLALFYMQTEQPELASLLLEELIRTYPNKSSLYFDTANAYLQQNDLEHAMAAIDKVEAIVGRNEMLALTKMDLIDKLNPTDNKPAYDFLEEYYRDCKSERMAVMLGDWYRTLYQDSLALDYYNQAIAMNEAYSPAYYGRAHCWQDMRRYDNYFVDINKFLTDRNIAIDVKSEYLQRLSEIPQMARAFRNEIDTLMLDTYAVHPADSALSYVVAVWYYRTNRTEEAIQTMKTCVNFNPGSYSVAFHYLLIQYYSKAWADLTSSATIVLQRFPEQDEPFIIRASAFAMLGENDSAIEDYRTVLARHPKDTATIVNTCLPMADIYYRMNDSRTAFRLYRKVLKVDPENITALNNYAYFLSECNKDLKKAREMSRRTIEKEPKNPNYLDTYAWILHKMGQDLEAKAMFKHVLLYGGKEDPNILRHYAEILQSLGENDLARIYFNQAKVAEK